MQSSQKLRLSVTLPNYKALSSPSSLKKGSESDDVDDLCPVCVESCTCQRKNFSTSTDSALSLLVDCGTPLDHKRGGLDSAGYRTDDDHGVISLIPVKAGSAKQYPVTRSMSTIPTAPQSTSSLFLSADYDESFSEEDQDAEEEDLLFPYDSVEYEYTVSQMQDQVISQIGFLDDPIDSLDIYLFSSGEDPESDTYDSLSFEIDLVPAQKRTLPDKGRSLSCQPATAKHTAPIAIPQHQRPQSTSTDTTASGGCLRFSDFSSKLTKLAMPATAAPNVCCSVTEESDDDFGMEGSGFFASDYEDGATESENSQMIPIEDILECTLMSTSKPKNSYKNEFLERYKHIPISAFRRSRQRHNSASKRSHPNLYKRYLRCEDTMLAENCIEADVPFCKRSYHH